MQKIQLGRPFLFLYGAIHFIFIRNIDCGIINELPIENQAITI